MNGAPATSKFLLNKDFRDIQHLRNLSKLIGNEIAQMTDEGKAHTGTPQPSPSPAPAPAPAP